MQSQREKIRFDHRGPFLEGKKYVGWLRTNLLKSRSHPNKVLKHRFDNYHQTYLGKKNIYIENELNRREKVKTFGMQREN
jgi:hypothetical protein